MASLPLTLLCWNPILKGLDPYSYRKYQLKPRVKGSYCSHLSSQPEYCIGRRAKNYFDQHLNNEEKVRLEWEGAWQLFLGFAWYPQQKKNK